jgi:prophage regulatory protein
VHVTLLRKPEVMSRCGRGNSALYGDIAAGLMVPPIKLGAMASAWPEHELEAVLRARVAGRSDNEIGIWFGSS